MQTPTTADTQPALVAPGKGFDVQEYRRRCQAVQSNMVASQIDLLWLSTEADFRYLTGFLTQFWQSPTRPWYLLLPQSGEPVAVIPAIGAHCMQRTWVEDIRTWSSPNPDDEGVSLLVDAIQELSASRQTTIGIPMGAETYIRSPVQDIENIKHKLPDINWKDATETLRQVRQIKSAAEVEKLRYICNVTSNAFSTVPDIIHSGMSEIEAFRAFRISCLQCGADDVSYLVGAASHHGYEDIISPPGNNRLAAEDILILDTGCVFDGYFSDFDRNFAVIKPDEATVAAHQRVWDATEAGLAAIRPGVRCSELFAIMQQVMQPESSVSAQSSVGRLGHGLGIQLTETPSIAAFDTTELQPGMVMTLEPGYSYRNNKMMVHEENLLVTHTGYELLSTRAPREIPVIS